MKRICYNLLLIVLFFDSCSNLSEYEKKNIEILNNKFPEYFFQGSGDVYLNVTINCENVDTSKLIAIFNDAILAKDPLGNPIEKYRADLTWTYLNVYKNDRFLFQLSKDIYGGHEFKVLNSEHY